MRQAITANLALIALLLPAGLAQAQDTSRYRLERTDDGYVRMDTETGAMSICKERGGELVCRLAADARTAFDDEVGSLQRRIDTLEARVTALEKGVGAALPSDADVDKTLGIMERFFRGFMDIVKDFEKQADEQKPAQTQPGRT